MDNSVSVRFFRLIHESDDGGNFQAILNSIAEEELSSREHDIGPESGPPVIVRLERLVEIGELTAGELIRIQTQNKPPEAGADGLSPLTLADGAGLGHSVAFTYHPPTSTLCIQNNPSGVSAGRLKQYLKAVAARTELIFDKVPTTDALERFRSGNTRSLEIELASAVSLPFIEGDAEEKSVADAIRMLDDAFQGVTVNVTVSMGRRQENLAQGITGRIVNQFLVWKNGTDIDLRKLRVKSKEMEEGGATEIINFLEEFLQERDIIDLSDGDPERNYMVRQDLVSGWHSQHIQYLTQLYG